MFRKRHKLVIGKSKSYYNFVCHLHCSIFWSFALGAFLALISFALLIPNIIECNAQLSGIKQLITNLIFSLVL